LCYIENNHGPGNHAVQNLDQRLFDSSDRAYGLSIPIPKQIFNEDYPVKPKTFAETLRKARMDAGLQVKELAVMVGVTADTVINWELRGMKPLRKQTKNKINEFLIDKS
jgi:hypothetical protein